MATLQEIETHYSLIDLLEANRYLDRFYKAQRETHEKARR